MDEETKTEIVRYLVQNFTIEDIARRYVNEMNEEQGIKIENEWFLWETRDSTQD